MKKLKKLFIPIFLLSALIINTQSQTFSKKDEFFYGMQSLQEFKQQTFNYFNVKNFSELKEAADIFIQEAINNSDDINSKEKGLLHLAILTNNIKKAKKLIQLGVDTNIILFNTPIIFTITAFLMFKFDNTQMLALLLENKTNPLLENPNGMNSVDAVKDLLDQFLIHNIDPTKLKKALKLFKKYGYC